MTFKKRYLRVTNLLFVILLLVQLLPNQASKDPITAYTVWFAVGVEVIVLAASSFVKKIEGLNLFLDIIGFLYGLLIVWTLATAKFNLLNPALFPAPGQVFLQFVEDIDKILINIKSSVGIILEGYLLASAIAIPLGLFLGWGARLGNAATYISKFLGSIPPIV